MTRDDIEDLFEAVTGHNIAHGEKSEGKTMYLSSDEVFEFARKIAAHEREECAKVCDNMVMYGPVAEVQQRYNKAYADCRDAIRARGLG